MADLRKRARQERALARFNIDEDRARADKKYKERKEQELLALKKKLGQS